MAEVVLSGVCKSFGSSKVIQGVDLHIRDGEFVSLVGPSGCGKSTLLRMVAGLESITHGDVSIGGRVVTDLEPKDRDIAMVFQNYALYPHMTVAANMGFSLEHRGRSKAEVAERVAWAAGILGLDQLLGRYPRQLSGGQRQRVAMGRAIVRDPQVFMFDEPLSNLDAKMRIVMRGEIKALHQKLKTTVIYVTHDQIEAMTMADVIVVLNAGRVEQIGAPLALYDRPANLFVAGFIGSPSMNLLSGAITADGFAAEGRSWPLPPRADGCPAGRRSTACGRSICLCLTTPALPPKCCWSSRWGRKPRSPCVSARPASCAFSVNAWTCRQAATCTCVPASMRSTCSRRTAECVWDHEATRATHSCGGAARETAPGMTRTNAIERIERPCGWYETVAETAGDNVERIRVHPGQQLSLQ